jgi:hypothetical protein
MSPAMMLLGVSVQAAIEASSPARPCRSFACQQPLVVSASIGLANRWSDSLPVLSEVVRMVLAKRPEEN